MIRTASIRQDYGRLGRYAGYSAGGGGGGFDNPHGTVYLSYASTITPDLDDGDLFDIVLDSPPANIAAPLNAFEGQRFAFLLRQPGGGGETVVWNAAYKFSLDIPEPVLSVTEYYRDYIAFVYNATDGTYDCIGAVLGFS